MSSSSSEMFSNKSTSSEMFSVSSTSSENIEEQFRNLEEDIRSTNKIESCTVEKNSTSDEKHIPLEENQLGNNQSEINKTVGINVEQFNSSSDNKVKLEKVDTDKIEEFEQDTDNQGPQVQKKGLFKTLKQKRIVQTCVLISICVLYGAQGGTLEAPAALQEQIMAELNVDALTYNLLYSLYSFPNIILVFVGGIVIDSILGLRTSGIFYTGLLLLGQIIMAIGAFTKIFPLMVVGRFIYGIGGESFQIVTQKYIVKWFRGKMLNIAFGIAFAFYRVCGFIQLNVNQAIYETMRQKYSLAGPNAIGVAFLIGAAGILLGLVFSVVLFLLDRKYQPRDDESQKGTFKQLLKDMKEIKNFDPNFYLLTACCVFFSIGFYPFNQLAQGFFISKYLLPSSQAVFTLSISSIVGTIASPVFGIIIGLVGYDLYVQYFIYILEILVHSGYAFSFITPVALIVFNGMASSIFSCVFWPLPAHIIKEEQLGIAYGFILCLQNLGMAIVPLITGRLVDSYGFLSFESHILFLGAIAAMFASIILYTNVLLSNGKLNLSAKEREKAKK